MPTPPIKKIYSFKIDPRMADALKVVKERDGVPESEQIRRGIAMWLRANGVRVDAAQVALPLSSTRRKSTTKK
jgi:hypothetical protein